MERELHDYLNYQQARELFERESVLCYGADAVPMYRVTELLGEPVAAYFEACYKHEGYLSHKDACGFMPRQKNDDDTWLCFVYLSGFMKLVSFYNEAIMFEKHKASSGGKVLDGLWRMRCEKLAAEDRKDSSRKKGRQKKGAGITDTQEAAVNPA